jgi:putative inorganic carbon (HCO3(-)) transporter
MSMVVCGVLPKPLINRAAQLITSAELPIFAAIAPALLFPTPTRLLVLVVVPIVWGCAWTVTGHAIPPTPLNVALWLLLAMVAVSLYATFDIRFSLGKVSGVILGVLVFWAVTRWVTTPRRLALATAAFVLAGAGLAVIGLLGANWFDKFSLFRPVLARLPRAIRGVPGAEEGFQPNAVAGCLVLFVPLQIALLTSSADQWLAARGLARAHRRSVTVIEVALLILTAGTLLLTQSRGAWVGMIVTTLAFLLWHSRTTRAVAALSTVAGVALAIKLGPARLVNLMISQSGPGMADDVSGRMEVWSRALYGIHDFPITGMGMNTFRKVMPILYPTFLTSPDFDVAHAHNHLLQVALDLGIPGLVAYASIWMLVGVLLVAVYRRSTERTDRTMACVLGAGLIAHFVFSMTDAIPLGAKVGVLFWLTLALAVALHRTALARQPH